MQGANVTDEEPTPEDVAWGWHRGTRDKLIRDIARAARVIEPGVVSRDGDGPAEIVASRFHGDRHKPDLDRSCGYWPEGDGWVVRVLDANRRSPLYHDMWLSDECLHEDYRGEVDATAVGAMPLLRGFAEAAGICLREVPPG